MTRFNPYNFVPLPAGAPTRSSYPKRHRFQEGSYSGILVCTLESLSPLISLDQKKKAGEQHPFQFLRNGEEKPIIQGASLKGMIRSVYEAMTSSCLPLAATEGMSEYKTTKIPYHYNPLTDYHHDRCNSLDSLCPACQLFGTVEGNFHCQGRVACSDAVLTNGSLMNQSIDLKGLFSPKPHFSQAYGKNGVNVGDIAGRKFYYHQRTNAVSHVNQFQSPGHPITIKEYAPADCKFSFQVHLENILRDEMGGVLLTLFLGEGLAHKIGLGKARGLGSCKITLEEVFITQSHERYGKWQEPALTKNDVLLLTNRPNTMPPALVEVLRLNKSGPHDDFRHPGRSATPIGPLDALGEFGGNATEGGRPDNWPEQEADEAPADPPPLVQPNQQAAWLKKVGGGWLTFVVHPSREEAERPEKSCQTPKRIEVGKWFVLSGTKSSRRAD